jgi:hypothetical protein
MRMVRQDRIRLFTEDELRTALSLTSTPDSAAAVAAALYALPPEESVHFNWLEDALLELSCVSEDVAQRVLDNFATTPDERTRLREKQVQFCEWVRSLDAGSRESVVELEDVVLDARTDVGLDASHPTKGENIVVLFTEAELRKALTLLGPPDEAAEVAARLYALSSEEQARLHWTDIALGLLSAVSEELHERVFSTFGTTRERAQQVTEMREFLRAMADSGELRNPDVHLALETVVRGPDGSPPEGNESHTAPR